MNLNFIISNIVKDSGISEASVKNTVNLLQDDATIHFVARYRKEVTHGLDETQIRNISESFQYYIELEKRKETILKTIKEQDKLSEDLEAEITQCTDKQKLEDLYLPYKPKKRTKATIAKEKGLEPLANIILLQWNQKGSKQKTVAPFITTGNGVNSYDEAISGAEDIVAEKISDDAQIRQLLRDFTKTNGTLTAKAQKKWADKKSKYESYYKFSEPIKKSPSHRMLAIRRGARESILNWKIEVSQESALKLIESKIVTNSSSLFNSELLAAIDDSYKRLIWPSIEVEVFLNKIEEAESEAIAVFSKNLRNLLMFPPAGHKTIIAVDPGYRTGCKIAVIDGNGNLLEYNAIFPHSPQNKKQQAENILLALIQKHNVELVAISNGTASKETATFVSGIITQHDLSVHSLLISEAGASVYSASEIAKAEFPNLDVTIRGAISIARRLQDPLSELVKIDPKSIGVGQYQHDVNQAELKKSLNFVVESCVNLVGVNLSTASVQLLSHASGIGKSAAENIIKYRAEHGTFNNKNELLNVPRLGTKVFQQCAGFLRIPDGNNPLDNSAIHPESYYIVEKIAADNSLPIHELIGNKVLIAKIDAAEYTSEEIGIITLRDILTELQKPGVDPRQDFKSIQFSTKINSMEDLEIGMTLEGTVTNVTNFGAFVDIGVHQDGLIHISELSKKFVKSVHSIISVGETVNVKIISIDTQLKRIGLQKQE